MTRAPRSGGTGTFARRPSLGRSLVAGGVLLVLAGYVADAATMWTGKAVHDFLRDWFVLALYAAAAGACLARGLRVRTDRPAWLLLGIGIVAYALGTLVWVLVDASQSPLHVNAASALLWLAFYPAAITAVLLLVGARARRVPIAVWLDAAAAALALAALVAALGIPAVTEALRRPTTVAVGLGYPALDVVLFTLTLWAMSMARWRPHRSWWLLAVAFALLGIGDTALAIRAAQGTFHRGELTSACFPLAMAAIGLAARQPAPPRLIEPMVSLRVLALPATACMAAAVLLGIYVGDPFSRVAAALAVAALVVGVIRAVAIVSQVRDLYESRRYARGFEDSSIGMALVTWDMTWLRVNPALCRMLRHRADQLEGHSVLEVTYEEDRVPVAEERARGLADPQRSIFQKRYVRSDGVVLNVELITSLIEDDEVGTYFYTQVRDVSDRRRAERRQALVAELGFRALDVVSVSEYLGAVMDAVRSELDVTASILVTRGEHEGVLARVAGSGLRTQVPYSSDSMAGWALSQRRAIISNDLAADQRFRVRPDVVGHIHRGIAVPVRAQAPHVLIAVAGNQRDPFDNEDAHFLEAVGNILASVLDREASDRELRHLALVDGLTGLANRSMLDHHLATALSAGRRADCAVAVLLLDLDNFKFVNDTLGHPAGDQLLAAIADRLRLAIREEDLLARLGGDEFVVACTLPHGELDVSRMAGRMIAALEAPFAIAGQELHVGASIGIAVSGQESTPAELLRDADVAMYRAKSRPESGYEVFDADLRQRIVTRVTLERELRQALRCGDQLLLYYQPIVDLDSGVVRGFESLVRWQHPRHGLLAPGAFLSIAEESGLIVELGEHLLDLACARVARWTKLSAGRPYVTINLSARQLTAEIPTTIAHCLREHGVSPEQLTVEVTEHVLLNPEVAVPVLRRLREMGVEVALDDFGAGYSSLSYLETYPLDAIKLDRGFVTRASNPRSAAILRAAVEMGAALGLAVVAEGIETEAQRELLQELGCRIGQGYLFARPLPPQDADALVADGLSVAARQPS